MYRNLYDFIWLQGNSGIVKKLIYIAELGSAKKVHIKRLGYGYAAFDHAR